VLFHVFYDGSVSLDDRESAEWAAAITGLIEAGLLIAAADGAVVLADDVQYGLRLPEGVLP
jgi:hypothetical protein